MDHKSGEFSCKKCNSKKMNIYTNWLSRKKYINNSIKTYWIFYKKTISNKENLTEGNIETASKLSEITNDDGSITYISQITEKKVGIGIIPDAQKVEEISLGVSAEDTKYVDAIRAKKELGILFDDKLSTYISVNAFENILKKMDENLDNYFDALSFGIYSYQEIIELKKSIKTINK